MGQPEYDLIMVNQIIHTFAKEQGYMLNNGTQESWQWEKQKNYVNDPVFKWMQISIRKMFWFMVLPGCFLMISAINGMVIRIALLCSNIILIPIMAVLNYTRLAANLRNRTVIYHSMGVMGA